MVESQPAGVRIAFTTTATPVELVVHATRNRVCVTAWPDAVAGPDGDA